MNDDNAFLLDKLLEVKSNYNVIKWEQDRRQLESAMDKGRHSKYPHIFKVDDIIVKQKNQRENMIRDFEQGSQLRIGKATQG